MTEQGAFQVECYSGHTYAQEPRALIWEGQRYRVIEVEQRWRTPDGSVFWVRTESNKRFELVYQEVQDRWVIQTLAGPEGVGNKQAKILAFPARSLRPSGAETEDREDQD